MSCGNATLALTIRLGEPRWENRISGKGTHINGRPTHVPRASSLQAQGSVEDLSGGEKHEVFEQHRLRPDRRQNPLGECFLWDADHALGEAGSNPSFTPTTVFQLRTQAMVAEVLGAMGVDERRSVVDRCLEQGTFNDIGDLFKFSLKVVATPRGALVPMPDVPAEVQRPRGEPHEQDPAEPVERNMQPLQNNDDLLGDDSDTSESNFDVHAFDTTDLAGPEDNGEPEMDDYDTTDLTRPEDIGEPDVDDYDTTDLTGPEDNGEPD
eukprot:gene32321-40955_t